MTDDATGRGAAERPPAIPFLRPAPPRLSDLVEHLRAIEDSGVFTNFGPVNTRLEAAMTERIFGGAGGCLTVGNATLGLMLAIRRAAGEGPPGRYALMPSFTFAATAQAAIWAGLTPLFCDIEPDTWLPSAASEEALLAEHGERIAVVVPYATFGNCLDLGRYARMARRHGVGIVVDAAASLGALDAEGRGFGAGFPHPVVFSMHATKTFATAEAGLIHCGDPATLAALRAMANFGFGAPRTATMPGLNAKLSEVGALLALARLEGFEHVVAHREKLADRYRRNLPDWEFQRLVGRRHAHQFVPVLLPHGGGRSRAEVLAALAREGIGAAHYFSPHLAEQPYFRGRCPAGGLAVTARVAGRILSLPLADAMTTEEVDRVCAALRAAAALRPAA
ncbi:aminotransferase DegT [Caldovatus sediminis]|uniref:Aminotransferase DegT n=1 Tax=Caldovatus sediminis TaxID=2041189 RepID=A0A8J2ZBF6_9PROT|nr:DegT/DnrJ/EryC1/StrS family aminotransferase [Caldovatus sediminis]GGG35997.1 aminotransferase DegT [Caldovatus sediminis]